MNYIRQSSLLKDYVPFGSSTLWRKVKAKQFPAPVKLSERVTAWRLDDVKEWQKNPLNWGATTESHQSAA